MSVWDLWLPIVVTGVVTHILSTLAWTVLPHHKPEWSGLSLQDGLDEALRTRGAQAGKQFMLHEGEAGGDTQSMNPALCRGTLIMWSHTPNMGVNIGLTLAYFFFTAFGIGYLASVAFTGETKPLDVFRFTATAGLLIHAIGGAPSIIWFRRKFLLDWLDGAAYALATGAAFALLWPS